MQNKDNKWNIKKQIRRIQKHTSIKKEKNNEQNGLDHLPFFCLFDFFACFSFCFSFCLLFLFVAFFCFFPGKKQNKIKIIANIKINQNSKTCKQKNKQKQNKANRKSKRTRLFCFCFLFFVAFVFFGLF